MVNLLVTAGAGFIGSNFVRYALAEHADWRITTLDKFTYAGRVENLRGVMDDPRHRFVRGDGADVSVAAPLVNEADLIVHFAAETHVDRSIQGAGEFITTDVYGTFVLLEAARSSPRLRRFIQISTDEVYGNVPQGASKETDEVKPRSPYAASKTGADRLAQLLGDLRSAGHHHPGVEQLRSLPVSGKGHSALRCQRDRRAAGAALRRRSAQSRLGFMWSITAARWTSSSPRARVARCITSAGDTRCETSTSHARSWPSWAARTR